MTAVWKKKSNFRWMKLVANCRIFGVKKSHTIVALVACKVWYLCDTFYTKKEQMKSVTLACKKCEAVHKKISHNFERMQICKQRHKPFRTFPVRSFSQSVLGFFNSRVSRILQNLNTSIAVFKILNTSIY
jgi:hypothetical protein